MKLNDAMKVASAGMTAQSERLRVVAENIANADSTARTPGGDPYRRKTITFQNKLDKELGIDTVKISKRAFDRSEFIKKYEPSHPAADEQGYVLYPNVNTVVEMVDMKEARRSYEANLGVVEVSKAMMARTLDLLR